MARGGTRPGAGRPRKSTAEKALTGTLRKDRELVASEDIRRYDSAGALFFLDPPYDGTEGYGIDFGQPQYEAMAGQLAGITGQFILSINDTPFIRRTFARFRIDEVETTWTLSSASAGRAKRVTELIIRSPER